MPTSDPKGLSILSTATWLSHMITYISTIRLTRSQDPLNMPRWRKWTAIGFICFCMLAAYTLMIFDL